MPSSWTRHAWKAVTVVCVAGVLLGLSWDQYQATLVNALILCLSCIGIQ